MRVSAIAMASKYGWKNNVVLPSQMRASATVTAEWISAMVELSYPLI